MRARHRASPSSFTSESTQPCVCSTQTDGPQPLMCLFCRWSPGHDWHCWNGRTRARHGREALLRRLEAVPGLGDVGMNSTVDIHLDEVGVRSTMTEMTDRMASLLQSSISIPFALPLMVTWMYRFMPQSVSLLYTVFTCHCRLIGV